jgi:NAD+ synthase
VNRSAEWSPQPRLEAIYNAMVLGCATTRARTVSRRRARHVGRHRLGADGGSRRDALGASHVRGVRLPRVHEQASLDDAEESARLLGMRLDTVPIEETVAARSHAGARITVEGRPRDVSEENLQARVRGLLLMGLSNKFGELLVTTGNKSEMSVGYADALWRHVRRLLSAERYLQDRGLRTARWRNEHIVEGGCGPRDRVIPESSITKAPTAELRPNQTDQDSLPPYEELDAILQGLIEEELSVAQIVARGFTRETVTRVQRLLYAAEYKRRQAPLG